ncbi:MAG TPA: proton-conducting transporter membrane subunit [Vicinamibacterales bacterium]|nr:proton-conducting transporter membrane subunit [Vicinamibacterales bacterium]HOG29264.1 proton-conducting transporter membrane subunit [Vicinamibacterales bacterium]HOQ60332.1 proton-conducting transporter membrane subunit [Vicinamibacterales bacterium]HPK70885.1 proton-conducting transporter membrane subunit [Vicinamibacterales bacterium]HPW21348.1 proton-conducting transporter membrane subunit [Vicinamibacterales bacterium]
MTAGQAVAAGLPGAALLWVFAAIAGLAARGPRVRQLAHALLAAGSASGLLASLAHQLAALPPLKLAAPPILFGAPFVVDRLSAFFLMLLHGVSLMAAWFGWRYGEDEAAKYPPRLVVPLTAVFCLGMHGVLLSSGAASFLLFWEAMSVSSFFLVMADGTADSRKAALLYLAVAQAGALALLVGIGVLGGGSARVTLAALGTGLPALPPASRTLALGLVAFAFTSKAGLAPFHAWLPEAHPRAPSQVSALMSGVMLKIAVYGLLRFTSICWPALPDGWSLALAALGLGGAVVAVISANIARDIKRILAWSSVENLGLVFAMFGFSALAGAHGHPRLASAILGAMFLHVFAHALFKAGLFLGAGAVLHGAHTAKIEDLGGLANRMPRLSAAMLALALAAAPLPPFGAFAAEWLLVESLLASFGTGELLLVAVGAVLLTGVAFLAGMAVFAMVRLFAFTFLAEPRSAGARLAAEPPAPLRSPVAVLALAGLALGVLAPWASPLLPIPLTRAAWTVSAPPAPAAARAATAAAPVSALPLALAAALAGALVCAWLAGRLLAPGRRVRRVRTWDCGQPIDATMEYTATGFSAPLRFFLRDIVTAEKHLVFSRVHPANPWITRGSMEFRKAAGAVERIYLPIAGFIEGVGARLKLLQNGVIQFYVALMLVTLMLTLWVAL